MQRTRRGCAPCAYAVHRTPLPLATSSQLHISIWIAASSVLEWARRRLPKTRPVVCDPQLLLLLRRLRRAPSISGSSSDARRAASWVPVPAGPWRPR
jgi:hypothetical protein